MEFLMSILDGTMEFAKSVLDVVTDFWNDLDEDKKKLFLGCVVAGVAIIAVASIAYGIGKAQGRRLAIEEEDF
jgi:hypothetical protein